jgi:hypothetical protein
MSRTKSMRLLVRDLGDALRWANAQQARHITDFRYRLIGGRESVSFRLIPAYPIQVGTTDIVVVCHVRPRRWRSLASRLRHHVVARLARARTPVSADAATVDARYTVVDTARPLTG